MTTLPEQEAKIRTTPDPSASMLNTWFRLLVENNQIYVLQANNEQLPITEEELQLPVRPMPLKKDNGYQQVGDYQFKVKNTWGSFIVERKSTMDLYGTLFSFNSKTKEKQRERLYREIERSYADERYNQFIIMVEGSREEFLRYVPPRKACKHCVAYVKNPGENKHIGICKDTKQIVKEFDSCHVFYDVLEKEERAARIINAKKATINALNVRPSVQVIFCGSRADMVEQFRDMIRQYCLQNWKFILGDEDENNKL